ncbi:MAG TPA: site-specific integrase, partial [bacterium]|nr:site-specific integrase [bacterium]
NGYDSLWLSEERRPMTLDGLKLTICKLCRRAGLKGPRRSAHTFRHTFATNWLRNGGGEFVLQQLLGHSTLTMTRRYVQSLNAEDAAAAHVKYSPVDNLLGSTSARRNAR